MNYHYRQNADLRLEHVRGIFFSIEEEMPPQIKFPTSKQLLKNPLIDSRLK